MRRVGSVEVKLLVVTGRLTDRHMIAIRRKGAGPYRATGGQIKEYQFLARTSAQRRRVAKVEIGHCLWF